MAYINRKDNTYGGYSHTRINNITQHYFGYPKPLNIIVKETVPPDSEMLPIWAAYFNMARYNMYTTLVHIAAATGLSDGENMENRMGHMRVLDEAVDPEVELRLR